MRPRSLNSPHEVSATVAAPFIEVSATAAAPFIEVSAYLRCTLPSTEVKQKRGEHDIGSEEQFSLETTYWDVPAVRSVMLAASFLTNSHHELSATVAAPFIEVSATAAAPSIEVSAYLRCTLQSTEVKQKRGEHDIGSEEQFSLEITYWDVPAVRSVMLAASFLTNSHHEVSATVAAPFIEVSAYLRCTLPSKEVKQKRGEHDVDS